MKKKFLRLKWEIISHSLVVIVFGIIWQIGGFLIVGFPEKQSEERLLLYSLY